MMLLPLLLDCVDGGEGRRCGSLACLVVFIIGDGRCISMLLTWIVVVAVADERLLVLFVLVPMTDRKEAGISST